jgi:pilus assembly protein CpaB
MKRVIAVIAAVILATVGTVLLVNYVRGAEERALEGEELVNVLVVDKPVERGTLAESLADSLRQEAVPLKVRADDSVTSLTDLAGLVTAVDLVPGEQLLASRFVSPESLVTSVRLEVPPEYLQVTVSVSPDRAVGGRLAAGDRVAILASFEPFEYTGVRPEELEDFLEDFGDDVLFTDTAAFFIVRPATDETTEGAASPEDEEEEAIGLAPIPIQTPRTTHIIVHKALVTNVQVEELPPEESEAAGVDLSPTGNLLITIAATPEGVERIVFASEYGRLWLAAEDEEAPEPVTPVRTSGNIYE